MNLEQDGICYDEFGNPIECPEQAVPDDGTITVKDQKELNYANKVVDEYMADKPFSAETFEAIATGNPIGGTAEAPEFKKDVVGFAPVFGSENWYGLKHVVGIQKLPPLRVYNEKMNLLESNFTYAEQFGQYADDLDYERANKLFSTLGKVPVINGKPLDLTKLPELMKDPAMKQQIMKVAGEYEKLPEVQSNWDLNWELNVNHAEQEILRDRFNDANNIIYGDLKTIAGQLDSKFKAKREWQPSFLELFNDKGALISEKEYNALLLKKTNESIAKWEAENPKPKTGPVFWQRTDQPNPMGQKGFFDPITNKWVMQDSRPKMQSSQEGWEIARENNINAAKQSLKNHPSYSTMVASLKKEYNQPDSKGVNRVRALFDSKDNPFNTPLGNTGGRVQSIPRKISFDLGKGRLDEKGDIRDEAREFSNVTQLAVGKDKDKIFYNVGAIQGEIPEERDSNLETFFNDVNKELSSGKHTNDWMPTGSITFQNIAGGSRKMQAFNVKFDTEFLKRFVGTELDKGPLYDISKDETQWNDVKNNGITIYMPKDVTEEVTDDLNNPILDEEGKQMVDKDNNPLFKPKMVSLFGGYNARAAYTSATEAQFQRRNKVNLTIPNCGSRTIIRNADNSVSIVGYNLIFDHRKREYNKVTINQANIPGSNFFDLDDLYNKTLSEMKIIYDHNGQRYLSLLDEQNSK